ncbi:MAG: cation diffusion facilitator family transporter [Granulosicoccus sp.]
MKTTQEVATHTIIFSICGNAALALIKAIAGVTGNSYALIADAIESVTDVFSSLLVLVGIKYATKPPDDNHPYGHGRAEPLLTFTVVGILLGSAALIAYESIQHIRTPHEVPETFTLFVLAGIIIVKELSYRYVVKRGKQINSTLLTADAWHHRSDAITSLTAFIGISVAIALGDGYENADDWAALLASGFIVFNAYLIFRPALGELMDEQLHDDLISKIRHVAMSVGGVVETEKCFVRKAGLMYHVDLHLVVCGDISVRAGHTIAHNLKAALLTQLPQLSDVLIHVEPCNQPPAPKNKDITVVWQDRRMLD